MIIKFILIYNLNILYFKNNFYQTNGMVGLQNKIAIMFENSSVILFYFYFIFVNYIFLKKLYIKKIIWE
jgi:hypothetical protein